jgi:dihydrofolate reductase
MRRIVTFEHVTPDGYFATPDGKLDWVVSDDEVGEAAMKANADLDLVLYGRKTFEMMAAFWPKVRDDADTAPDPHSPGKQSPMMKKMADFLNKTQKLVFSKSMDAKPAWQPTRVVRDFSPRFVEDLKNQPGKDIILFGSGSIVSQLTQHRLIDEYIFVVSPVLLGSGRKLIEDAKSLNVRLEDAKGFASGVTVLRYVPKPAKG